MDNRQAKRQRLSLVRIATLITKVFGIVTEVTDLRILLSEVMGDELRLLLCYQGDLSEQELAEESTFVSKKSVTAMRSHNHCVFVCKVFAGLLAHWIERLRLPVGASEADVHGVYEFQPVVCVDRLTGTSTRIAATHTMFKLVALDGYCGANGLEEAELFLDASAGQYLRPAGLYTVKNYPKDPAADRQKTPAPLGAAYVVHLRDLHDSPGPRNFRLEAIIRTVNNEVYKKMGGPEWHGIVGDDDDTKWEALEREVCAALEKSLRALVANLDHNPLPHGFDRLSQHKLMARLCMGTGHTKIMESLERVSGVEVTRFQNF